MYIYSVKCRVNKEIASEWEAFFIDKHLDDLVKTGCFTHYEFRKLMSDDPISSYYISNYHYRSQGDLDIYNSNYASDLKQDVVDRFNGKFQAERSIYKVLTNKIQ